jgi:hypothetical protein
MKILAGVSINFPSSGHGTREMNLAKAYPHGGIKNDSKITPSSQKLGESI